MARLLFRLQLCPSFFLYSIASSFLMTYELIEPALTSYGGSFEFPVLGIDLPAAVLLSEVLSKASSPWILGGFASCVGLSQAISSRYAHLCATKGKSPRFIAVRIMLQAVPLSLLYCTITLLPAALVSALACKSPLDAQALEALSLQGVVVETQKPYLVYPCLFFAFYAKCMLIFVFSRSALLLVPFPSAASLMPAALWIILRFTPMGSLLAAQDTLAFSLDCLISFSPMSYLRFPGAIAPFLSSFLIWCAADSALPAAVAVYRPSALVLRSNRNQPCRQIRPRARKENGHG